MQITMAGMLLWEYFGNVRGWSRICLARAAASVGVAVCLIDRAHGKK